MELKNYFNPFWINYLPWVKKYGEIIFAVISTAIAVICSIYCYVSVWCIVLPVFTACFMFAMNKWDDMDTFVNIGCCALIYAVFQLISCTCNVEEEGVVIHLGYFLAALVCSILYKFSPVIVAKITKDYGYSHEHSWGFLFFFYAMIGIVANYGVNDRIDNAKLAKEVFVPVKKWSIETHQGETYYIVTCSRGTLAISPFSHPEIREINDKTQIRFLKSSRPSEDNLTNYSHIEIKN